VVALLSKADQAEIAQVRQAAPTLKDPDVKKYAQMLIDDHTKAFSAVTAIGAKLGYPSAASRNMMPPADPMPAAAKPYERPGPSPSDPASAAQVNNPDREFIEGQITGHQQLISQLPANDAAIQNQELRTYVGQVRLAVQTHLSEARRLRDKVAGAMP
jgi:predicted outer membrane protein